MHPEDVAAYRAAVQQSAARVGVWNPVNPDDITWHLQRQSEEHRTFLIHAVDPQGSHGIVGKVNVTNVVRGRFQSGVLGYDSYDPYVGKGLFAEGLRQIVNLAFTPVPQGMGLHRLEANVRPGNARSAGLLRSLGFRREGMVRDMLWLPGADGAKWRDHIMHAITREEWPAPAYAPHRPNRMTVLVEGLPGSGRAELAPRLAAELGLPLFSGDLLTDGPGSPDAVLWALLAASPIGGVVEHSWRLNQQNDVAAGLRCAGFDPARVPHVWCDVVPDTALRRVRNSTKSTAAWADWADLVATCAPQGFGVQLVADGSRPIDARTATRLALQAQEVFAQ